MATSSSSNQLSANQIKKMQDLKFVLIDLERWLDDLLSKGLSQLPSLNWSYWEQAAARLVDAKAPGLAKRVKEIGKLVDVHAYWPDQVLQQTGELILLIRAYQRFEDLSPDYQEELSNQAGFPRRKKVLLEESGQTDDWMVLGQSQSVEELLYSRRTWLQGRQSGKFAVILDHHFGSPDFEDQYIVGEQFRAELVFYPGLYPMRALVKARNPIGQAGFQLRSCTDWSNFLDLRSKALAKNPFLETCPALLQAVIPIWKDRKLWLKDPKSDVIHPVLDPQSTWRLMAISSGHPIVLFGEWNREGFVPLSIVEPELGVLPI
ncbi:MAG: hypothetical protein AAF598_01635 [Bacteroidota bacterium]